MRVIWFIANMNILFCRLQSNPILMVFFVYKLEAVVKQVQP